QYWGFSNLVTYPENGFRGYWIMHIDDATYEDARENFIIGMQPESNYRDIKAVKLLKPEYCLYEEKYQVLKARITFPVYDPEEDNFWALQSFSGKIISKNGFEYELPWDEEIPVTTTKIIKEIDLTEVTFLDDQLPLGIGEHTLEITYGIDVELVTFKMVPLTVESMKSKYLTGVDIQSTRELVIQQDLRLITGVEIVEISNETPVGTKEFVWNATDQTLQWDYGDPVPITDEYSEYILMNMMGSNASVSDGDYIRVVIDDIDELPAGNQQEFVVVDVKKYSIEDYQYWIENGYNVVVETIIMTSLEPTLYSSNKELVKKNYKYLDPVMNTPKPFSETSNISFEFPVNMLQSLIELWGYYRGAGSTGTRVNIEITRVEFSTDGQITIRGWPFDAPLSGNTSTLGLAGLWDRTIFAKNHAGARNKVKNFWQGTVIAGITDKNIRDLVIQVSGQIAAMDLLIQAGLGRGAGISSRSFSVSGISSSYNTTESAENSLYSGVLTDMQRRLGVGKASAAEQKTGLIQQLKNKVIGGALTFKY
ncbi:hypothetical protein KAR91_85230, partial [Candidatus Pacearchaeota archaeon]|nr:hypothetical protein [Candidatus Pacearchaeota archaeon]